MINFLSLFHSFMQILLSSLFLWTVSRGHRQKRKYVFLALTDVLDTYSAHNRSNNLKLFQWNLDIKGTGKVLPRTGHERPEGE
jgi:hypothetical protein